MTFIYFSSTIPPYVTQSRKNISMQFRQLHNENDDRFRERTNVSVDTGSMLMLSRQTDLDCRQVQVTFLEFFIGEMSLFAS